MKPFIRICVGLLVLATANEAQAEMTASELLNLYDAGDKEMRDRIETIIDGNSNGVSWVNSYLDEFRGATTQIYCPPEEFTVDGPGMIRMMRTAIEHDPRYSELPYGATVMFAYIDHFPCP